MNNDLYRECELKYKIQNKAVKNEKLELMLENGYIFSSEVIETDYIFDTKEYLCKKNNLIFRMRNKMDIKSKSSFLVFTLKIRGMSNSFQDNYEIEFHSQNMNKQNIKLMIGMLQKKVGIELREKFFWENSAENILFYLRSSGFSECGIMQKKRSYYIGNNSLITFDVFPNTIGTYLEIEASNENDLFKIVEMLKLKKTELEKRNYGQLILKMNSKIVFEDEKTCT